jgi:hypothetical protein
MKNKFSKEKKLLSELSILKNKFAEAGFTFCGLDINEKHGEVVEEYPGGGPYGGGEYVEIKYDYETGQHGICELYDHKDEYSSFITHLWGKMNKDHLRKLYHLR